MQRSVIKVFIPQNKNFQPLSTPNLPNFHLANHSPQNDEMMSEANPEWMRNILKSRPDLSQDKLERTRQMMNDHILNSLVENFEGIELVLNLPDADDNHVLVAAIVSSSNIIVTFNLKDFPLSH